MKVVYQLSFKLFEEKMNHYLKKNKVIKTCCTSVVDVEGCRSFVDEIF